MLTGRQPIWHFNELTKEERAASAQVVLVLGAVLGTSIACVIFFVLRLFFCQYESYHHFLVLWWLLSLHESSPYQCLLVRSLAMGKVPTLLTLHHWFWAFKFKLRILSGPLTLERRWCCADLMLLVVSTFSSAPYQEVQVCQSVPRVIT